MDILLIGVIVSIVIVVFLFWKILLQQVNAVASIVTVIGVLGTFLGIAIGLYQFDTENIEASVPALLEGLKVAFVSSIVGIIVSILLKVFALYKRRKQAEETDTGATVDDLVETLKAIYEAQQSEGDETRETLRAIEKALTGDGDSTVLTQLQKLRTTFSDKQDDLIDAFRDFAAQVAENNTQALIKALEEVMRDFNAKINEQFGDNFKQLNEAVGRINDWQEQYRQQMDELAAEFRIAADSIEKSRQSLEIIAERSDAIVSSAEKLDPILQALQDQIQEMNARLEAFSALADNARNAFPIIEDRLNQLTADFSQVVKKTIDASHASMEKQREALADQSQQLETTVENTSNHIQQQTEDIFQKTTIRIEEVIESTFQGLKGTLEDQSEQLRSIVIETNQGLANTLQNQSAQLETMVENTSTRLREMADDFSQVVTENIDASHASMENQREALQDFTGQIEAAIQSTAQGLERTVAETNRGLANTLQNQSIQLESIVEDTNRKLRTETERVFRESADHITQQIGSLDNALEAELTKAIESLGSQLTSLSRQFVQDYTPLTDRLRDVVRMAEGLSQSGRYSGRQ